MRHQITAGLILVSSLSLMVNCGGDGGGGSNSGNDSGGTSAGGTSSNSGGSSSNSGGSSSNSGGSSSNSGGSSSSSGGSGGSGGSSSGGSSSGGSSSGGSSSGGSSTGGASSGGSSSGGTGGSGEGGEAGEMIVYTPVACPSDIGDLAEAMAQSICEKRVECCSDTMGSCLDEVENAWDEIYPELRQAVTNDTAALNCTAFDTCVAAIHEASCSDWPAQVGDLFSMPVTEPACLAVITPKLQATDTCSYNYECQDGYCSATGENADDMCHGYAGENEACDVVACDPKTHYCNSADLCQKKLDNGVNCTNSLHCLSGVCDSETNKCVAPGEDECLYVPQGFAACAVAGSVGVPSRNLPWFFALGGLGMVVLGRRRARR